jgi:acyl phosphate:glycerol-3-phosphate acyltransferase
MANIADPVVIGLAVIISYLIGAIPTGYILTRMLKGVDVREHGSSNVGATNVYRVAGKIPGFATLVIDILKGVIVVAVVAPYTYQFTTTIDGNFYRCLLGFTAICGHIWTIFLRFKGGKGVATTIGVLIIIAPKALAVSLLIWVIVFSFKNYVSVASIIFGISLPIVAAILGMNFYVILFLITLCILSTYKHKENIKRLLKGEENKTIIFKKRASG